MFICEILADCLIIFYFTVSVKPTFKWYTYCSWRNAIHVQIPCIARNSFGVLSIPDFFVSIGFFWQIFSYLAEYSLQIYFNILDRTDICDRSTGWEMHAVAVWYELCGSIAKHVPRAFTRHILSSEWAKIHVDTKPCVNGVQLSAGRGILPFIYISGSWNWLHYDQDIKKHEFNLKFRKILQKLSIDLDSKISTY